MIDSLKKYTWNAYKKLIAGTLMYCLTNNFLLFKKKQRINDVIVIKNNIISLHIPVQGVLHQTRLNLLACHVMKICRKLRILYYIVE